MITFACYGCHLHSDESGSDDREHNLHGSRLVASDLKRVFAERARMDQSPSSLDSMRREAVLASLLDHCCHRNSTVFAAHVGSSHVHIVVESEARLERIMNDLKSYASLCLNRIGLDPPARKRWARQHPVVICGKHVGQRSGTW